MKNKDLLIKKIKISLKENFHALSNKNFRVYWIGYFVSIIGTWIQRVGQSWLVLEMTNSPKRLAFISTLQFLPVLILSLFAGVIVDRVSKKKIIIVTQAVSMVQALVLSFLVLTNRAEYWHIAVLAIILGIVNSFDMTARQSFVIEVVGKDLLTNAVSLNSMSFNLGRVVGPALGAIIMSMFGAGICFLLNGVSFTAVLFGLFLVKAKEFKYSGEKNIFSDLKDGIKYIAKNKIIVKVLFLCTVMAIFIFNYDITIPILAKEGLGGNEKSYGMLLSSLGIGSVIGAMLSSLKFKKLKREHKLYGSILVISILFILLGMSKVFFLSMLILFFCGFFNIMFSVTANSTLQFNSEDKFRGRVMSVYTLVSIGFAPIGSTLTGELSERYGINSSFILVGIASIIFTLLLLVIFKYKIFKFKNKSNIN